MSHLWNVDILGCANHFLNSTSIHSCKLQSIRVPTKSEFDKTDLRYHGYHQRIGKRIGLIKGTPVYQNKIQLVSSFRLSVDNSEDASEKLFFAIAECKRIIFEFKWLNCDNSWWNPLKPYLPTPSPHNFKSQHWRGLSFGPQDRKSWLRAMPEGTEREVGPKLARQKLVT